MEKTIEAGDYVRHKNGAINGGLEMSVIDISDTHAMINHFDSEGVHKEEWIELSALVLVRKADGGFI